MIRVSKKAVILTEPADWIPTQTVHLNLQKVKHFIKNCLGRPISHQDTGNYEPDGNYVFSISEREIEKIALGLNLPAVAFKRFQDIYFKGVEDEAYISNGPLLKAIYREQRFRKIKEIFGIGRPNNIQVIIFKENPDPELILTLKQNGYHFVLLPINPYV
jgi:hypothetical protein